MATRDFSILNSSFQLGSTGAYVQPYDLIATNDFWKQLVLVLPDDGSTKVLTYGHFVVPQNFVDTALIIVEWTANVTTNNAVFDLEYRAVGGNDTESLDQATAQESLSVTDAAPSMTNEKLTASMSVTDSNLAVGDIVEFRFGIDGSDAACTLADDALVFDLRFRYNDA